MPNDMSSTATKSGGYVFRENAIRLRPRSWKAMALVSPNAIASGRILPRLETSTRPNI
jgi:hypothetical protein